MKHMKKLISLLLLVITLASTWSAGANSSTNSDINLFSFNEDEVDLF